MEKKRSFRGLLVAMLVLPSLVSAACTTGSQASLTAVSTDEQTPLSPAVTSPPPARAALPTVSSTPDAPDEPVSVTITADALGIANNTPADIYYAVFPQEELALIEWAPCQHPNDCPEERIAAGQSISLSLQTVAQAETTVITVFWWHLVENSGSNGYHDADLTFIDVEIR